MKKILGINMLSGLLGNFEVIFVAHESLHEEKFARKLVSIIKKIWWIPNKDEQGIM